MSIESFTLSVTIANGASLCTLPAIANNASLVGIQMPGTWTAANLTFQGSGDGVTYQNCFDNNGVEVQVVAAAAVYIPIPPTLLPAIYALNVRSGTSGTPVNQGAARTIQLCFQAYQ